MTTEQKERRTKLAAILNKLGVAELEEIRDEVAAQLKRHAKKAAKKPSEMNSKEFETWAAKEITKHEKGEASDDE